MKKSHISSDFSINKEIFYLNHAAVSPWPVKTVETVKEFANENGQLGATHYPEWEKIEQELRDNISLLINAPSSDDIALVKNTSEALSFVAYGLKWSPGDNIVIARQEFPSNRIVWQSLKNQGVEIKLVDLYDTSQNNNSPEESLLEAFDSNTRLLSVSSVQYADGLCLNLEELGNFCQSQEVLFCVDAIQSIGAQKFDVQAIKADFAMADGHKWLMSPEGLGLFYCKKSLRSQMKLTQFGWRMVDNPFDFDSLTWSEAQTARKFECGSPNMLGIHALNCSIKLILERKIEFIEQKIGKNSKYIVKKLEAFPEIQVTSPLGQSDLTRMSGIISFWHKRIPSETLYSELMKNNVICAMRNGNVRFSPHYYTSTEVIESAFGILKKIITSELS
ncbi:MAG: aminotransferase class V-fold PLP-dependent enzyme [Gammaproteobacteria bacterium]|nr:aminotransferase class V-fold PLP-dependent enzyme [Gammaproteobacteria bacterium]